MFISKKIAHYYKIEKDAPKIYIEKSDIRILDISDSNTKFLHVDKFDFTSLIGIQQLIGLDIDYSPYPLSIETENLKYLTIKSSKIEQINAPLKELYIEDCDFPKNIFNIKGKLVLRFKKKIWLSPKLINSFCGEELILHNINVGKFLELKLQNFTLTKSNLEILIVENDMHHLKIKRTNLRKIKFIGRKFNQLFLIKNKITKLDDEIDCEKLVLEEPLRKFFYDPTKCVVIDGRFKNYCDTNLIYINPLDIKGNYWSIFRRNLEILFNLIKK